MYAAERHSLLSVSAPLSAESNSGYYALPAAWMHTDSSRVPQHSRPAVWMHTDSSRVPQHSRPVVWMGVGVMP